ncbi:hypothetical protein ABBQ32_007466 [Trebouxia sp. C0010 RCD-2024]
MAGSLQRGTPPRSSSFAAVDDPFMLETLSALPADAQNLESCLFFEVPLIIAMCQVDLNFGYT